MNLATQLNNKYKVIAEDNVKLPGSLAARFFATPDAVEQKDKYWAVSFDDADFSSLALKKIIEAQGFIRMISGDWKSKRTPGRITFVFQNIRMA